VSSLEQIMREALLLPVASRALLAEKLIESLEFDIDDTIEQLWLKQAQQRRDEIRSGSVKPISGEEALP